MRLVVCLLVALVAAGGIWFVLTGDTRPGKTFGSPSDESAGSAGRAGTSPTTAATASSIPTVPFKAPVIDAAGEVELAADLPGYSADQAAVIRLASEILDSEVPRALIERPCEPAVLSAARAFLEEMKTRKDFIQRRFEASAARECKRLLAAGQFSEFRPERYEVDNPREPGRKLIRYTSPRDGLPKDVFVAELGGTDAAGNPISRVVRLTKEGSPFYADLIGARDSEISGVREQVRTWFREHM